MAYQKFFENIYTDLDYYKQVSKKLEQGKNKIQYKLFCFKKLFSIPWLIIGDEILNRYPSADILLESHSQKKEATNENASVVSI